MKQVQFLHAANPGPFTGAGNWTYLIDGDEPVLVDAGVGHVSHLDALAAAAPGGPSRVLVTHGHDDHMSGSAAIRERWPAARLAKRPWPGRDPAIAEEWDQLDEGAIVTTGAGDLEVLHTPGHTPDHLVFWHRESRTLFVGDLLVLGSTVFIPASEGGDLVEYLRSLRRLLALNPRRALPAHGPAIDDPQGLIQHYLEHRHQREVQVLTALESGYATVPAIASRIYSDVAPALLPMAQESVRAHLQKLVRDGLARRDAERWIIVA